MGVGRRKSAVAAMVVGAAGLLVVQLGDPAHAQQASSSVLPGTASAGAALVGVVPQVSGLTLTTTLGEADAAYEEQEAQAKSGIVDLGGLGYFLAGTDFCGAKGLPLSEQPQPLSADSQNGATTRTQSVAGQGAETVSVSPQPERASATTTPAIEVLPGVLEVSGREEATVQYVAGTEQEADASVVEDVAFLNGLVQLNGLTWTASRRAGGTNESSVSFSLGQVIINHVPLDRSGLSTAAAVALVNDVIGVFGFTISLPAASSDPVNGSVSMGPLVVQFSGSRVDRALLSPSVATITGHRLQPVPPASLQRRQQHRGRRQPGSVDGPGRRRPVPGPGWGQRQHRVPARIRQSLRFAGLATGVKPNAAFERNCPYGLPHVDHGGAEFFNRSGASDPRRCPGDDASIHQRRSPRTISGRGHRVGSRRRVVPYH
jgi:hypothetical protein